jgi:hypothetical protein
MISLQQKLETSKSLHDEDKLAFLPLLKKKKKRVHKQKKEKKIIKLAQAPLHSAMSSLNFKTNRVITYISIISYPNLNTNWI